jgi:hypothetical protein
MLLERSKDAPWQDNAGFDGPNLIAGGSWERENGDKEKEGEGGKQPCFSQSVEKTCFFP